MPLGKLSLSLSDFAPAKYFNDISDPIPTIDIPYSNLAGYLNSAEQQAAAEEEKGKEGAPVGENAAAKASQGSVTEE